MALIGIDASRANAHERTGTEWYAYYLIQAMKKFPLPGLEYVMYSRKFLRDGLEEMPAGWYGKILPWKNLRFWNQFRLSWELFRHPVDLLFQPTHTLPLYRPKKVVTTLHDVGFERMPKLYRSSELNYHRYSARLAVRAASRILTVSEFSKREICEVYGVDPARVIVTPNAVDATMYHPNVSEEAKTAVLEKYRLSKPFFLYVGRLEEKKNLVNILHAFSIFKGWRGVGDPVRLLLAGSPGFGYERIQAEIDARKLTPHLLMPGYVPEADLPALYASADALIFPTRYEGFGIPIVQAQAVGTPVLTSDSASMPEVGGRGALYVKAEEPDDIAEGMKKLVDDMPLRESLRAAGLENVKRFSWDDSARLALNAILEVLGIQHQV